MKQKTLALISLPLVTAFALTSCANAGDGDTSASASQSTSTVTSVDTVAPAASDTTTAASKPAASTSDTSAAAPTTEGEDTLMMGTAATEPTSYMSQNLGELVIQDARVGAHDGFDRVVFEFKGTGTPGFHAGYNEDPRQQASGHELDVAGNAYLEIMIHGTPMGIFPEDDSLIGVGPMDRKAGNIQGITHGGVFEADTQYVIGLDKVRPYSVTLLENPTRVVIDIEK